MSPVTTLPPPAGAAALASMSPGGEPSAREIWNFLKSELRPKGPLFTPFNVITGVIVAVGVVLLVIRFATGLGSITNLSQDYPWGLWIGFDVITGVAFAGGGYVLTFMVYVLGLEKYRPILRVTVLNAFLAYVFYAGALLLDLGRPWNVINPIIGNSFGLSSVLFLVAWHFLLYMLAALVEFSPAVAEWLGLRRLRMVLGSLTVGAVIFGITLSTLHQSGLGALYMMARDKVHPLWYSEYIPVLFLVSSIFAGLSMVIFEGSISERVFAGKLRPGAHAGREQILVGLARVCAGAMFVYLFLKVLDLTHAQHWPLLWSTMGVWWLLEVVGFVAVPMIFFAMAVRHHDIPLIRLAAGMSLLGIVLNRLNISIFAFKWYAPVRYAPSWMEVEVTLAVIAVEIWAFRWIVNRMPVLGEQAGWVAEVERGGAAPAAAE